MSILLDAHELVNGSRNDTYGHPLQDFQRVAVIWSGILNTLITPEQVGLCLIGLKLARECYQHKRDTLVDVAGYAETLQMIADAKEPPCPTSPSAPTATTSSSPNEDTSSVPSVVPSTRAAVKDEPGTCPKCQRYLPHASLGRNHSCA